MELAAHRAKARSFVRLVSLQDLHRDDQCVLQEIVENHTVEDINRAIVRATGKERVFLREIHRADSLIMVLQVLVRSSAHVHIEPDNFLVVSAEDEVVTLWMNRDRRYPLCSGLILIDDRLLLKVILEHLLMGSNEEVGLCWMELHRLNDTLSLSEGSLRRCL